MEVHHAPKPFHGWREFLKEYGIIVLGVLTALAAEQIAEQIHWADRVHEAEDAMDAELHGDAANAYFRLLTHGCAFARIDAIRAALEASRDRGAPVPIMPLYNWRLRPMQADAWQASQAAQIVSHFPRDRMLAYSHAYFFVTDMGKFEFEERSAMDTINTLAVNAGRLEPAERDRVFAGLVATRRMRNEYDSASLRLIGEAEKVGVRLTDADKAAQIREARQLYGGCVRETSREEVRNAAGSWPK